MLLTYNLHIRNTDPRFQFSLVLYIRVSNVFRSQMKNAVSYMWGVTVLQLVFFKIKE